MSTPAQLTQDELLHALLQGRVDSYRQPKVPDFFKEDPALWFAQVESSLSAARINNQKTMADVVVAALKYDVVTTIKDILFMSPVSAESKLRQLLKGEVLSKGKPSQILTGLLNLNDGSCSDEIIRAVFLEQLPSHVRAVLAMANVSEPRKLAELADKVVEASGTGTSAIAAVSSRDASLRALEEKVDRLTRQLASITTSRTRESRVRRRTPSRSRNRSRENRSLPKETACWFHRKFGKDARRCVKPSSWETEN
ncbi:uncharacterized protein LOC143361781 [Halictus rubicundus]|uniref:uncharacterized protein LOC143361781 n=1 Tax=Halictus rubicundus TaxID=77578 RepID=UPI0040350720